MDGGHAFRTMAAYEQWLLRDGGDEGRREVAVLRLMGLFDRPADAGCLAALLDAPAIPGLTEPLVGLADDDWEFCLSGLEAAKLLTVNRDAAGALVSLDAHPLLREYFARQLRDGNNPTPGARPTGGSTNTSARPRRTRPQPTLEDLQPLYQAVAHGCQAGLQQEAYDKVYFARILRRERSTTARENSAHSVPTWERSPASSSSRGVASRPRLTEADQAWLLNEAAFCLRALGRLTEALEPMRAGLEMAVKQERTGRTPPVSASNLSELELTLGEVAGAVGDAEQSVTYADRSGDAFQRMGKRTTHADALHQAGRRAEAETRFREAEQMQTERQPDYPLLYSLQGFRYCDLLFAAPERAAWEAAQRQRSRRGRELSLDALSAVLPRRLPARGADARSGPNGIARPSRHRPRPPHAGPRRALRGDSGISSDFQSSAPDIATLTHAVSGLRRAGQQHHLPLGLLTRAWLRFLTGARTGPESAQGDLDEAWEIAERGPMPLFLADIHLYRARLFFREAEYPWESPQADLAEARRLIEKHGYWRRKEELEDAEAAIAPPAG